MNMGKCKCGAKIGDQYKYCSECGPYAMEDEAHESAYGSDLPSDMYGSDPVLPEF